MDRRAFAKNLARAAVGAATLGRASLSHSQNAGPRVEGEAPGVPFKLSVMLWTVFEKLPFIERLEKVSEAGYHAVELVGEFEKWSDQDYANVNKKKRELGITFDTTAGLKHGLGDPRERDALIDDLRNMIKVADKLECSSIIVMSGDIVPLLPHATEHQSVVEGLKRAAAEVEKTNITLLLENIDQEENPKYFLKSVAEGFRIIQQVNHPRVKILYDFYHEQIYEGNLIEKLEKNIDKVGLIHIADVPGRHEPGTGEINYMNIYKKLAQLKYNKYVAMEFLPTGDPVKSLRNAREAAIQAARV